MSSPMDRLDQDGYCIIPDALDDLARDRLCQACEQSSSHRSEREGDVYGARNLLRVRHIAEFANSPAILRIVAPVIGEKARPVRGIFFDKTPRANWPVPWHQDLTLALADRVEIVGWHHWSVKGGVVHAQPPLDVLQAMVTLRFNLDACGADNGPLRVLPGSHRQGLVAQIQIAAVRERIAEAVCTAEAGSVLMMRPLLLHASSPAKRPAHRRVLHLEYAPEDILPPPLQWAA